MAKLFLLQILFSLNFQNRTQVIIKIEGIDKEKGGKIAAGIFSRLNFPEVGQQTWGQQVRVNGSTMEIIFKQITPGTYAMVAFQDIDENGLLKTNLLGFPKEPVGFSNNAQIKLGPPAFSAAQVKVKPNQTTIVKIILK